MPLLEVHDLVKVFSGRPGALPAVDHVSFSIERGETLGLVGESGCGKTTLSRSILRLEQPSGGKVVFDGEDLSKLSSEQLRKIRRGMQIVFQDPYASLDPRWTVEKTVGEPLRVHNIVPPRERRAELIKLLGSVGLPASALERFPHEFSGGQRQRIGIARALALRPQFLIADEPVSALDVSVRAQILNLLRAAQAEYNLGMLFIAHDLGAVRQVSRRIMVMYLGKIMEEGPADEIFDNPRNPYTRTLLAAIPSVKRGRVRRAAPEASHAASSAIQVISPGDQAIDLSVGCRFRQRCPYAQPLCADQEPPYVEVSPGHRSYCHFALQLPAYEFAAPIPPVNREIPANGFSV